MKRLREFVQDHMTALIVAGLGLVAAVVLVWGMANNRTRDRARAVTVEIGSTVATTQIEEAAAIGAATEETRGEITQVQDRTRRNVARVRMAAASPVLAAPAGHGGSDPVERAFFAGVCSSPFYVADPACRGDGGRSEDPGSASRP